VPLLGAARPAAFFLRKFKIDQPADAHQRPNLSVRLLAHGEKAGVKK
jgi:hypothetical protein